MVIVTIKDCLKELDHHVIKKIATKQNEVMSGYEELPLQSRYKNQSFLLELLQQLSPLERKHLLTFFTEYSPLILNEKKNIKTMSVDEKLALLLLRQKGLLFKLENDHQQYVFPIEIVHAYFSSTFFQSMLESNSERLIGTKKYLSVIFQILNSIEQKNKLKNDAACIDLLISFLQEEELIDYKSEWNVLNKNCQRYFQQDNNKLKKRFVLFLVNKVVNDPLVAHFIVWLLYYYHNSNILFNDVTQYLNSHWKINEDRFNDLFNLLQQLEIVSIINGEIGVVQEVELLQRTDENLGIELAPLELLIPTFVENSILWTLNNWGEVKQWDEMLHISFTTASLTFSLSKNDDIQELFTCLKEIVTIDVYENWRKSLLQVIERHSPIKKITNVTLYTIEEPIHIKLVEKEWSKWKVVTDKGILIESSEEQFFETLLQKVSIKITRTTNSKEIQRKVLNPKIVSEFPEINQVVPELQQIPIQWFRLTSFEEKIVKRMVKQAIAFHFSLEIITASFSLPIQIYPEKVAINHGRYEIITEDDHVIPIEEIIKICIVHPLQ